MPLPSRLTALLTLLVLAGCGVQGPPEPALSLPAVNMHTELGKIDGSTVLAAPTGWTPGPTVATPLFKAPAPQLFAAMQEQLLAQPRTWRMAIHPDELQASFIIRSVTLNLPDVVVVQAFPVSPTTSNAVIFSRSRYDALPFISENKARVAKLIAVLTEKFGTAPTPAPATPAKAAPATPAAPTPPARPATGARNRSRNGITPAPGLSE